MAKKAQAAVEFLMTYGWAILMMMVVVGAFAYLGFTNPQKYINDKCTTTGGFDCSEIGWVADAANPDETYIAIFITNLQEEDIVITAKGEFEGDCQPLDYTVQIAVEQPFPDSYELKESDIRMERKVKQLILFSCPDTHKDRKYKINFELPYRELRTTFNQTLSGEITIQGTNSFTEYTLITP